MFKNIKKYVTLLMAVLLISSCKAKYEELSVKYNATLAKKKEAIKDRKRFESLSKVYNDSITILLPGHKFWKRYSAESDEIVKLKTSFVKNGLKP